MNRRLLFPFALLASLCLQGQVVLNDVLSPNVLPNKVDSNNLYVSVGASYIYPLTETTNFQKANLQKGHQRGNRFQKAEMEILFFTSQQYSHRFEPYVFFRTEAFPMSYISSKFGVAVADRNANSSVGFFFGNYLRNVPYEANFTTRRGKSFENYPLYGGFLQSSRPEGTYFLSLAREYSRISFSSRMTLRLGQILSLGKDNSFTRTSQLVLQFENLSGYGAGFSLRILHQVQFEVLWTVPVKEEQDFQARLRNKLSRGFLFEIRFYVN